MIILTANQKGGVGKTTLNILLSNFLVQQKQEKVVCIDLDFQASLYTQWKTERQHLDNPETFYVVKHNLSDTGQLLKKLRSSPEVIFVLDVPGTLDNEHLLPIYKSADLIICPIMYDKLTYKSTYIFARLIQHVNPKSNLVFIPNRIKTIVKYELEKKIREELSIFGRVLKNIPDKAEMHRVSIFTDVPKLNDNLNHNLDTLYDNYMK